MDCSIIFYMAHKTSYCETSLKNILKANDINPNYIYPAFSPEMLGENINNASENTDIIFVIGGFNKRKNSNVINIIQKGFNNLQPTPNVYEIKNSIKDETGYLLTYFNQRIVFLPDEPAEIVSMISKNVLSKLM